MQGLSWRSTLRPTVFARRCGLPSPLPVKPERHPHVLCTPKRRRTQRAISSLAVFETRSYRARTCVRLRTRRNERHGDRRCAVANVKPIPDGYPRVTPYLCVDGAAGAIASDTDALGATE